MARDADEQVEDGLVRHRFVRPATRQKALIIDNLLIIVEMIWWTGLAPWEFEFPLSQVALHLPPCQSLLINF